MIERHRRFSSLYSNNAPLPTLYRSASARSSRTNTPEKSGDSLHSHRSRSVSLSSLAFSPSGTPSSRSAAFSGNFFVCDLEDIGDRGMVTASSRRHDGNTDEFTASKSAHEREARRPSQADDSVDEEQSHSMYGLSPSRSRHHTYSHPISPSDSLRISGHNRHSLASELGTLYAVTNATEPDQQAEFARRHSPTRIDNLQSSQDAIRLSVLPETSRHSPNAETSKRDCMHDEDEHIFGSLMKAGPPNAEAYEELERALSELPITWADDDCAVVRRAIVRDIEIAEQTLSTGPKVSQEGLSWAYVDTEEDTEDNDPWKEEGKGSLALEDKDAVEMRMRADHKADRRRRRLQELAEEMMREEEDLAFEDVTRRGLIALRHQSLERSDAEGGDGEALGSEGSECEELNTSRRLGASGTDYWPVSVRARYHPAMVVQRVRVTSQEYFTVCLLWMKFLAVLAIAVLYSVWRGPKTGLGLRRLPQSAYLLPVVTRDKPKTL